MKLTFNLFDQRKKEMSLSKINIIYGYSNCGKTRLLNQINDGFNQKNKSLFLVNGYPINKNDYECLYFDSSVNFAEQLKFGNKSLFKKILIDQLKEKIEEKLDEQKNIIHDFNNYFETINTYLNAYTLQLNQSTVNGNLSMNFSLDSIDEIFLQLLKPLLDQSGIISSSTSKDFIYELIIQYVSFDQKNKIILIDNFDHDIDEEITISFINKLKKLVNQNYIFILTTNKATSLPHIINYSKIYTIKNENLFDITKIKSLLKNALQPSLEKNYTFEEYMLENNIINDDEFIEIYQTIMNHSIYNLGRILVNKNYSIVDKNTANQIAIIPTNKNEEIFLNSLHHYFTQ